MSEKHALVGIAILAVAMFVVAFAIDCDTSTPLSRPDDDSADDDASPHTAPAAPKISEWTTPTPLSYQSIHGTTDPNCTIHVTGGVAPADVTADATGAFCVRVALNQSVVNQLSFTAENSYGDVSKATVISIQQARTDLGLAGTASASSVSTTEPGATPDKAIDGNLLSWWRNTTNWLTKPTDAEKSPQWLMVKLKQSMYITELDIYWGVNTQGIYEYGTKFDVYLNDNPTIEKTPDQVRSGEWAQYGYHLVQHVEQAPGQVLEENTFDLSSEPVKARWLVLSIYQSNAPLFLSPPSGTVYSIEVAELEAYGLQAPDVACE